MNMSVLFKVKKICANHLNILLTFTRAVDLRLMSVTRSKTYKARISHVLLVAFSHRIF